MKKFLSVIGSIVLMFAAIFGGEFVRDIGLGDSFSTFLIIAYDCCGCLLCHFFARKSSAITTGVRRSKMGCS